MNKLSLLLCFMFVSMLGSCNGAVKPNETGKAVEKTDSCQIDSKNSYEVYIPQRANTDEKLPLLVIIDSHGSGKFALAKFKQAANHYPAILVASNLIKNGFEGYDGAILSLIEDVRQKYPVNETVFVTGFSGGARMALGYALVHPVKGLILCGALANADQINALRCPVISISGMDDFNFMETAQYLFQEQSIPGNLKIELTNASHDWPDSKMLTDAFGFLRLSSQGAAISTPTKSQLTAYCHHQHARIDSLKQQGDYLKAALVARNMASTEVFSSDTTFASTYNNLKSNNKYVSQLDRLGKSLNYEISVRQSYIDAFQTKDSVWWKNEINATDEKIKTVQDSYTKDMYRRIKGFWGIACYSLGNQAVKAQNAEALIKIVSIYRMLEPDNSYVYYFAAFPYLWKGDNQATLSMLKKAKKAGFSEMGQLKKDFPEAICSKLY